MKTNEDTLPAGLRQLLVDAAAAIENLTDGGGDASLAGFLRDAAAGRSLERSWDVTVTTIVNVKMPYGIDPTTDEGADAIRDAVTGKVADCLDAGSFDIACEEYLDG